ncbi:MAG: hypothetical protein ACTHOE_05920 [Conexibacter sp.]
MRLNDHPVRKWLGPLGLVLAALVIVGGTLEWSLPVVYGLTGLMFATVLAARSAERGHRRE